MGTVGPGPCDLRVPGWRKSTGLPAISVTTPALNVLQEWTGLYLAISPWVVGFQALTPLAFVNLLTGLTLVALAFGFGAAFGRLHGLTWVISFIGAWTFVAPWVIRGGVNTTPAVANNVTVGAVCVVLGLASLFLGMRQLRR